MFLFWTVSKYIAQKNDTPLARENNSKTLGVPLSLGFSKGKLPYGGGAGSCNQFSQVIKLGIHSPRKMENGD